MDLLELMKERHSVRQYTDQKIEENKRFIIEEYVKKLNEESDLHIQVFYDEEKCFDSLLAHYGRFENVADYISIVGKKDDDLEEKSGYYGELLVLKLQELSLNSCWVALTHGKSKAIVNKGEKEAILIAFGYGANEGHPHKNKDLSKITKDYEEGPEWFKRGIDAAMYAPTAVNQQKFQFDLIDDNKVKLTVPKSGACINIDKGIVKCHFELGAGTENFSWV